MNAEFKPLFGRGWGGSLYIYLRRDHPNAILGRGGVVEFVPEEYILTDAVALVPLDSDELCGFTTELNFHEFSVHYPMDILRHEGVLQSATAHLAGDVSILVHFVGIAKNLPVHLLIGLYLEREAFIVTDTRGGSVVVVVVAPVVDAVWVHGVVACGEFPLVVIPGLQDVHGLGSLIYIVPVNGQVDTVAGSLTLSVNTDPCALILQFAVDGDIDGFTEFIGLLVGIELCHLGVAALTDRTGVGDGAVLQDR